MKLTKSQLKELIREAASEYVWGVKGPARVANKYKISNLKQIIKEEIDKVLSETWYGSSGEIPEDIQSLIDQARRSDHPQADKAIERALAYTLGPRPNLEKAREKLEMVIGGGGLREEEAVEEPGVFSGEEEKHMASIEKIKGYLPQVKDHRAYKELLALVLNHSKTIQSSQIANYLKMAYNEIPGLIRGTQK